MTATAKAADTSAPPEPEQREELTSDKPTPIQETSIEVIDDIRAALQVLAPDELIGWINQLVYGEPGVGKTHYLGTALDHPATRPALILDVEGGMITLRKRKDLDVIPVRDLKGLESIYDKLWRSIKNGEMYYKTVCIDSGTELADLDMRVVMKQAYNANPDKVHIDVPSPREWGIVRSHMRKITRGFKDLPCNFIMTATLGQFQDENRPVRYFPGFGGKLQREVPGFMDIVGMMTAVADPVTGVITRKIQVQGTERVVAKDRFNVFGGMIEDPTIPKLWDIAHADS